MNFFIAVLLRQAIRVFDQCEMHAYCNSKKTNLAGTFGHRVHPNRSPLKIWEKRERGRIQGLHDFLSTPISPLNISGKVDVGVLSSGTPRFSGHP